MRMIASSVDGRRDASHATAAVVGTLSRLGGALMIENLKMAFSSISFNWIIDSVKS